MRRFAVVVLLVLIAGSGLVQAGPEERGSVLLASGTPTIARELYNAGHRGNTVGWVFALPPGADGKTYTLTRTRGVGNLDVYFYGLGPDGQIGEVCNLGVPVDDDPVNQETESGTICPGPVEVAWGMVILRTGADASFSFTW